MRARPGIVPLREPAISLLRIPAISLLRISLLPVILFFAVGSLSAVASERSGMAGEWAMSAEESDVESPRSPVPDLLVPRRASPRSDRFMAVKTNAVLWAATIMNVEGEIQVSPKITIDLPVAYCPWFISERHALRVAAVRPEGRWWLKTPGEGHFGGLRLSVGWFNLKWNSYRYQDHGRPLLGAGLTYGYAFRLTPRWGLELSIGAGYLNLRYDRFYNTRNGQLADLRQTSYFGLDHLGVSLVYRIAP